MEDEEFVELIHSMSPCEHLSLLESMFSLECLKNESMRQRIFEAEERTEVERVNAYTDEEVFTKLTTFMERLGHPINLAEYLAYKRELEYEGVCDSDDDCD